MHELDQVRYGFGVELENTTYGDAVELVRNALKKEGFGILTEIDVKKTLKEKIDADFRNYVILGACNPPLAKEVLDAEPQIGLLLPCNVVVQDAPDRERVIVSFADPWAMFEMVGNPSIEAVVDEVEQRLRRVAMSLG